VPVPFPANKPAENIFTPSSSEPAIEFAENFSNLQGRFSFCADTNELLQQLNTLITTRNWKHLFCAEADTFSSLFTNNFMALLTDNLSACDAAITSCECLIARTGTIVLSSKEQGRTASVYAPVHICIAFTNQLVTDIKDALILLEKNIQTLCLHFFHLPQAQACTSDIEKTLVVGVHGPKEVFCFLVENHSA